jgi:hypothetical protein
MKLFRLAWLFPVALVLTACPGEDVKRDLNDGTAPTLSLTVTASKNVASGLETLSFGTPVELTSAGGSLIVKAEDDDGVGWVELWFTEKKSCGGTVTGPGLAGAPVKRTDGTVTDTDAPESLTAIYDLNTHPLQPGCTYEFDVWGRAANAATTAVEATSSHSLVTVRT